MNAWTAATTSFLASFVEAVEAFTILLAVGTFRGWRPALLGTALALAALAGAVVVLGPLIGLIPIHLLQLGAGILLLVFGLGWLRKAVLRLAGAIPMHDEGQVFAQQGALLHDSALRRKQRLDWLAGLITFKAFMLEGMEVIFIVLAVGLSGGLLWQASLGALAACISVLLIGAVIHKPLSRVPENTLKLAVGVMLSAFGVYWIGEGVGAHWPGEDIAIVGLAALFLAASLIAARVLQRGAR